MFKTDVFNNIGEGRTTTLNYTEMVIIIIFVHTHVLQNLLGPHITVTFLIIP